MSVQEAADSVEPVEIVHEVTKESALFASIANEFADSNEASFQDSLQSAGVMVFRYQFSFIRNLFPNRVVHANRK